MARERESLYDEAVSLSLRMSVTHFTSQIAEDELKNFIRFLSTEEHTPAQKLHTMLDRIKRTLGSISAAVEAHAGPRLKSSTPPGNRLFQSAILKKDPSEIIPKDERYADISRDVGWKGSGVPIVVGCVSCMCLQMRCCATTIHRMIITFQ